MLEVILVKEVIAPIFIVVFSVLFYYGLRGTVKKLLNSKKGNVGDKKTVTILLLTNSVSKYVIILVDILMILNVFGVDTQALIASIGVLGLVVGFALQDTLKDFLAGIFILTDNLFRVGDTITINGFRGEVMEMGLKTTRVRSYNGEEMIISNRSITEVINHNSSKFSLAEVVIKVDYHQNVDQLMEIMKIMASNLTKELKNIKGKLHVWGVTDLTANGISITFSVKTKPNMHFEVERQMRQAIKAKCDELKIEMPYMQVGKSYGKRV